MQDRLKIAAIIAAGLCAGIPCDMDNEMDEADKITIKRVAVLSVLMANALIEEVDGFPQRIQEA